MFAFGLVQLLVVGYFGDQPRHVLSEAFFDHFQRRQVRTPSRQLLPARSPPPFPVNLGLIAQVFGVAPTDLMPAGAANIVGTKDAEIQMSMSGAGSARLRLDMELPAEAALKVMSIINEYKRGA